MPFIYRIQVTILSHLYTLDLKDVSCNEIQTVPPQIGNLESLRDLNLRRNHLLHLPEGKKLGQLLTVTLSRRSMPDANAFVFFSNELTAIWVFLTELSELPLIRLDFSCNKITAIPVCYRNLRHLQTITLDNNPLQSPPAQVITVKLKHRFPAECVFPVDVEDHENKRFAF